MYYIPTYIRKFFEEIRCIHVLTVSYAHNNVHYLMQLQDA